jgi:hypothetical protein
VSPSRGNGDVFDGIVQAIVPQAYRSVFRVDQGGHGAFSTEWSAPKFPVPEAYTAARQRRARKRPGRLCFPLRDAANPAWSSVSPLLKSQKGEIV